MAERPIAALICYDTYPPHECRTDHLRDQPLIAIVDDDEPLRAALCNLIESHGYLVVGFDSGEGLLRHRDRGRVSCLISDVQMPGMDGFELHSELRRTGDPIPTILITAYPDERGRRRAREEGLLGYLTKPFTEDDLLLHLHRALGKSEPSP
jgi:FixJ family two-component response regulator